MNIKIYLWAWLILNGIITGILFLKLNNADFLEKLTFGLIPHHLGSEKAIIFDSTIDKEVFAWSSIFKLINPEFTYHKVEQEMYDATIDLPDFDTDFYYVPKLKNYCLANFLYYVLNHNRKNHKKDYLFFDYNRRSSLKFELKKRFRIVNDKFSEKQPSINLLENRKNYLWNPRIKVFFTKKPLHFNTQIGECFYCMLQTANHSPGEGKLSRPDLLAKTFSDFALHYGNTTFIDFYPKTYRLDNKIECLEYFDKVSKEEEFRIGLLTSSPRFWRKVIIEKLEVKIDAFEDRKLRTLYHEGKYCGVRMEKEIVQEHIQNKLTLGDNSNFVYRAFLVVTTFDPFVAYTKKGYILCDRQGSQMSFQDSLMSIETLMENLQESQEQSNNSQGHLKFKTKTLPLVDEAMRKTVFAYKDNIFKDSRAYQIFAFDFIVDNDYKPWLLDIKNAPYFTLKNSDLLFDVLNHQFTLLEYRNNKLIEFLKEIKLKIDKKHFDEHFLIKSEEHFLRDIYFTYNFKHVWERVKEILKSYPSDLTVNEMDLIYDERIHYGKKINPGLEKERFQWKFDPSDLFESIEDL